MAETINEYQDINIDIKNYSNRDILRLIDNEDMIKLWIEKIVDINAQNIDGNTLLHISCLYGKCYTCKYLVERGIDKYILNKKGESALDCVSQYVKFLICQDIYAYRGEEENYSIEEMENYYSMGHVGIEDNEFEEGEIENDEEYHRFFEALFPPAGGRTKCAS